MHDSNFTNHRKGRGAVSAPDGRFQQRAVILEADVAAAEAEVAPDTTVRAMQARQIIATNNSPDIPFNKSINPYMGCEHGCIYCYARPAHSTLDLSPGLDFETQIFFKPNAAERLLHEWSKPSYQCEPITIGANTDPYQPAEKQHCVTRSLLELFVRHRHPVNIISKGTLLARDLDLYADLAQDNLCAIAFSLPTLDKQLKRIMEPRVPAPAARLRLMERCARAGIPVSTLVAPVIPAINDSEIESILTAASDAGASRAEYIFLRLPHEVAALFESWLDAHFPERKDHVLSLVRQASGGKNYDARFGVRQSGRGPYADMLAKRFDRACRKLGLGRRKYQAPLDCSQFEPPGQKQLALDL